MDKHIVSDKDISQTVQNIEQAKIKSVAAANSQMLWMYWQLGTQINQKLTQQATLKPVLLAFSNKLSKQLPEHKCFSVKNLGMMQAFAQRYPAPIIHGMNSLWENIRSTAYPLNRLVEYTQDSLGSAAPNKISEQEFLHALVAKLTWPQHLALLQQCKNRTQAFWYMLNTLEHGNSHNILSMQIKAGLFERHLRENKPNKFAALWPKPGSDMANYLLKDPYVFDFAQAKEKADQRDIRQQLSKRITAYLLGQKKGFALLGENYHVKIGKSDYYTDLLFYHTHLRCYVVVELRARAFDAGDTGKLNFFINVINDRLKTEADKDTIGIIMCKGKNAVMAEYALSGFGNPIAITDYQQSDIIPEELRSRLPTIAELEDELRNAF